MKRLIQCVVMTVRLKTSMSSWKVNFRIYMRIIALLRPYRASTLGAIFCLILSTGFAFSVPWMLAWVIDTGLRHGQFGVLLLATSAILLTSALRGAFAYGHGYLSQALSNDIAYDLRNKFYNHLQILDFSFHDNSETGQLMSRLTVDIDVVRTFIPLGLLKAILAFVYFATVSSILFYLNWQLALVTMLCVPLLILLSWQVASRLRPILQRIQEEIGTLGTILQENLSGIRVVKAFAREAFEIEKFSVKNRELCDINMNTMRISAWNQPLMVLVLNIIMVLIIWVGGIAVIKHQLSLGVLVAISQYTLLLGTPVRNFGFMIIWWMRALSSGQRIFNVLDTPLSITEAPGAFDLQEVAGHILFEHVSFAYGNGHEVLHDIEMDIQPGQVVAILGVTGSGKSTILHLLPRFYEATSGRVLIDKHDVRDVTLTSLRRNIGLVLQDVFLFNATIRDNIIYGAGEVSDEHIIAIAKIARIHDFILTLADGYNTWIGERGVTLSGGQRQRVAIARTLLLNPQILILDDSTSNVDMETEYLIQQALDVVMQGRTTFVVTSRLHTIKNADQILILDKGRIIEHGTHEELLGLHGAYTQLYDLQLREQEELETHLLVASPEQKHEGSR